MLSVPLYLYGRCGLDIQHVLGKMFVHRHMGNLPVRWLMGLPVEA